MLWFTSVKCYSMHFSKIRKLFLKVWFLVIFIVHTNWSLISSSEVVESLETGTRHPLACSPFSLLPENPELLSDSVSVLDCSYRLNHIQVVFDLLTFDHWSFHMIFPSSSMLWHALLLHFFDLLLSKIPLSWLTTFCWSIQLMGIWFVSTFGYCE